jgi:probable F420-dependent oxidoreductase
VDVGLALGALNPRAWVEVTEEADRLGYESVWMSDHLVVPLDASGSPHEGADHPPIPSDVPVFDVFAYLSALAARTSSIRLGTNVYNVGLRHPFVTARAATTLDVLSGGRFLFGVGASWLRAEWDAVGLDFDSRGARVDETIDVLRRLWTEPVVSYSGRFFSFGPTAFEPKPVQTGGPPLHFGGDGPAALRRAATVGAGWIPMNHTLDDLGPSLARLRSLADAAGRTTPIEVTLNASGVASAGDVARYADAGVTRIIVRPWRRSSEAIDAIRRFAADVLAPMRAG